MRLAFIVSHPIQYYVPIYRGLAERIRQTDERLKDQELTGLKGEELERPKDERLGDEKSWRPNTDDRQLITDDSARISALKVFYTWRDAGPARDVKFGKEFAWDIPLMEGYDSEVVPNTSPDPGTHHRTGLINPDLVEWVMAWKPDVVHITGYNYVSHGQAIKDLSEAGIPVIFRGDSHLLDGGGSWWKWWLKKSFLSRVYDRPSAFSYVGQANRDYYRAFGVPERKLFPVPHTIEVRRFAEPNEELETKALAWRRELGIPDDHFVFLYAAKLEPRKRPMELLEAFLRADLPKATLVFVGSGELEGALKEKASHGDFSHGLKGLNTDGVRAAAPTGLGGNARAVGPTALAAGPSEEVTEHGNHSRVFETAEGKLARMTEDKFSSGDPAGKSSSHQKTENCALNTANCGHRVLFVPFQNQSAMPVVYRLGDALVLPSGYGETWGLAVNEAQACGRPSLVSDCVGCARDIIRERENGMIFRTDDWDDCVRVMGDMVGIDWRSKREAIQAGAWEFDTARGVDALLAGLSKL